MGDRKNEGGQWAKILVSVSVFKAQAVYGSTKVDSNIQISQRILLYIPDFNILSIVPERNRLCTLNPVGKVQVTL